MAPEKELVGGEWLVTLDPLAPRGVRCVSEAVADALVVSATAGGRFRLTMDAEINAPAGTPPLLVWIEPV